MVFTMEIYVVRAVDFYSGEEGLLAALVIPHGRPFNRQYRHAC